MADGNINVGVNVRLDDAGASAGLKKLSKEAEAAMTRAGRMTTENGRRQLSETQKLALARTTLGVRSEREIQAEINRTARSYERLAASGKLSMNALARAHEATKQKITALINEQGKLTKEQEKQARGERRMAVGQKALIGLGGLAVAGRSLKDPAMRAMSFDRKLAIMSNVANNDLDVPGRIAAMKNLEKVVNDARRQGGSTRDAVGEAYEKMLARGVVDAKTAEKMLPDVIQAAVAANADPNDMASIGMTSIDSFKIRADRIRNILTAGLRAGQLGGFEMNNMGRWLQQQMSVGGLAGMQGEEDAFRLMAYNQLAVKTAGSPDQAGTNIKDFINALSSSHFKQHAVSLFLKGGRRVKPGERVAMMKKWDDMILDYQKQGIGPDVAIMNMLEKKLSGDKRFVSLQNELRNIDPKDAPARQKNLEAQAAIIRGSAIGKLFGNQQEMAGFLAIYNNRDKLDELVAKIREAANQERSNDEITKSHKVIASTSDYKLEQAKEDAYVAQKAALDTLTPAIGATAKGFSDLTRTYPVLTGVIITTTSAVGAFATAVGGATFALRVMSGTRPSSVPGGIPPATVPTTGGVVGRGKGATVLPPALPSSKNSVAKAGAIGLVATGGSLALGHFAGNSDLARYGSNALTGASIGATIGSVVPVLGTGFGAGIGALVGAIGTGLSDWLGDVPAQKTEVTFKAELSLPPGASLQKQQTTANGGIAQVRTDTGNVMTGAPG